MNSRLVNLISTGLFAAAIVGAVSACSILPKEGAAKTFFVLETQTETTPNFKKVEPKALLVGLSSAGLFVNSTRILFSDRPDTRSFYQYSYWTEPPTIQFTRLLLGKFDQSNGYQTVSRSSIGAVGDYQLNTEIKDFYQDRTVSPPVARAVVAADAVSIFDRRILATHTFSESIPLESDDASGAVRALSKATDKIQNDIVTWAVNTIPKSDSPTPASTEKVPANLPVAP